MDYIYYLFCLFITSTLTGHSSTFCTLILFNTSTMEGGLPTLSCLLQHTLKSLCSCSSDSSVPSKWIYAVFWRIVPRNYPPPKWDYVGSTLDRTKRNWILVWEDGYCDIYDCERAGSGYIMGRFGADVFFKMSHEVYNYGEGLVGKVAAENSHKWISKENSAEKDSSLLPSWNGSTIDPQPKAWGVQFNSGIQTIAIISVKDGLVQLGSLEKIVEDLNLVINIQRKFSYLHSIPGVFSVQRSIPNTSKPNTCESALLVDERRNVTRGKRCYGDRLEELANKSMNIGWNTPHTFSSSGLPLLPIPPLLPSMSCSLGSLLSTLPPVVRVNDTSEASDVTIDINLASTCGRSKAEESGFAQVSHVKIESCLVGSSEDENPENLKP